MDVKTAWHNLKCAIDDMADPGPEFEHLLNIVLAGVVILYDYPPREIVAQVEASDLPTRPTVSWLVYEGGRLAGSVEEVKVKALADYWLACNPGRPLIPGPEGQAASGNGHGKPAPLKKAPAPA